MNGGSVVKTAFYVVFGFFLLLMAVISLLSIPLRTKATSKSLVLSVRLQGEHKPFATAKAAVDVYGGPQKTVGDSGVILTNTNGVFSGLMSLGNSFDFSRFYALFIKPEKYIGRVFCTKDASGSACTAPQMIFDAGNPAADLSSSVFLGGDIPPGNGKVDAQDMSQIMKNLGKTGTDATDINGDGITDVIDYSLALYSLGKNAADDTVSLQSPGTQPAATVTPAPTATGSPQATATPVPSATAAPTAIPTNTPTPTPIPTSTPTPIPAVAKCHFTLPAGYGDPFDINAGVTSACECTDAPFIGKICSTVTCKTCPSGTCNCTIEEKMPPYDASCTNGGSMSVNKVPSCN